MGVIDGAKAIVSLAQEVGKIELYQQAVDLMAQVTEVAQENFQLKQDLAAARAQVADLDEKLKLKGAIKYRNGVYFLQTQQGTEEGPFCSRCWDADHRLIHVNRNDQHFYCRNCGTGHNPRPPASSSPAWFKARSS